MLNIASKSLLRSSACKLTSVCELTFKHLTYDWIFYNVRGFK